MKVMSEHTKEPFDYRAQRGDVRTFQIFGFAGAAVAHCVFSETDASRIVACVNACARFSEEELHDADLWQRAHDASNETQMMQKQRDQLLAALKSVMLMDVKGHQMQDRLQFSPAGREILEACNAAIAAVEQPATVAAPYADGWIEWNGGECPVSVGVMVEVRLAGGDESVGYGQYFNWSAKLIDRKIVAYRVVKGDA